MEVELPEWFLPEAGHNRQDAVVVRDGILISLQYNSAHKVAATVAICIIAEGLAVARRRQNAGVVKARERVGPAEDVCRACDGHVDVLAEQARARQVYRRGGPCAC